MIYIVNPVFIRNRFIPFRLRWLLCYLYASLFVYVYYPVPVERLLLNLEDAIGNLIAMGCF